MFGLSNDTVASLLEGLQGTLQLRGYVFQGQVTRSRPSRSNKAGKAGGGTSSSSRSRKQRNNKKPEGRRREDQRIFTTMHERIAKAKPEVYLL